ncbi:ribosomal RNA-processing protein 7 homolog A-like [Panulirus ornatus]|uniref:ribosomal RNA-processing protein 7 homolog A-like n=1 Tax=Panulirus ornatus TaxID=150431 RepID=UPI003A89B088
MPSDTVSSVHGFQVVGLIFSEKSKGVHQLLWKKHSGRLYNKSKPPDRTLFIVNVPPYCTKDAFQRLFAEFGKVENVYFHKKPSSSPPEQEKYPHFSSMVPVFGFKVAYVVFKHSSAIKKAMSVPPSTVLVLSTKEHPVLTGMQKWQQEYNKELVSRTALSGEIKSLMSEYYNKCRFAAGVCDVSMVV